MLPRQRPAKISSNPSEPAQSSESAAHTIEAHRADLAEKLGLPSAEALPLLLLPANRSGPSQLREKRKKRFRAHLTRVVEEAFATPMRPADSPRELGDSPFLQQACATCRGRCCHAGGDHAFIDIVTAHAYMRAHPDASQEEVIDAYLARIGERTLDRGCVFQGEKGCALEREMRAAICNAFLCSPLERWRTKDAVATSKRALAVAMHGEAIVALSVIGSEDE